VRASTPFAPDTPPTGVSSARCSARRDGDEYRRLAAYSEEQRMVLGANTYRLFLQMLGASTEESAVTDPVNTRMRNMPTTVVSTTLEGPLDWPNATLVTTLHA
jgi:hypothetical protein